MTHTDAVPTATQHPSDGHTRLGDGVSTFPVALGVLAVWFVVAVTWGDRGGIEPAPAWLRAVAVAAVVVLAALGHLLARWRLRVRGDLVAHRGAAARWTTAAYLPVAVALVVLDVEANVLAVLTGALAMTSPGVHWVVLDGSSLRLAVARVLVAVVMTPVAAFVGFWVGYAAFFVGTMAASFLCGFLVGHLLTFVPLVVVGDPSRDVRPPTVVAT